MLDATKRFLEGSFASYAKKSESRSGLKFRVIDFLIIFIYSALSALLPSFAEAPMLCFPRLSRLFVLFTCAVGRGAGAFLIFVAGNLLGAGTLVSGITDRLSSVYVVNVILGLIKAYPLAAFLVSVSIPPLPLRLAFYSASIAGVNPSVFAFAVALGTVIRTSLIFWVYRRIALWWQSRQPIT